MMSPIILIVISIVVVLFSTFTVVPEGHVGLYWVLGKLQPKLITMPLFYLPLYSKITFVKYIQDHDEAKDHNTKDFLSCVSKEGVTLYFESVKIANQIKQESIIEVVRKFGMEYDKVLVVRPVAQKMKEVCAEMTVDDIEINRFKELDDILRIDIQNQVSQYGITVDWVRISGIVVPKEIKNKRLDLASEKADKLLVDERSKKEKSLKEHEIYLAAEDEKKRTHEFQSRAARTLIEAEARKRERDYDNQIIVANAKAMSEKQLLEFENLKRLFAIPGYTEVEIAKATSENQKIYYGEKIPNYMLTAPTKQE